MSLDKQIKEMAEAQLTALVTETARAVTKVIKDSEVSTPDMARLVSEHKTKSTFDKCVKQLAAKISKDMMASLGAAKE